MSAEQTMKTCYPNHTRFCVVIWRDDEGVVCVSFDDNDRTILHVKKSWAAQYPERNIIDVVFVEGRP